MNLSGDLFIGSKVVEEKESKYNGIIRVIKTLGLGTYIQVEGITQSGGVVDEIWKSTLKRVKKSNKDIKSVLILGLGGGSAAKWVRKCFPKARITGVDIDPLFIKLGKKYLGLGNFGVDIKILDARDYLKQKNKSFEGFDLILIDIYRGENIPDKFMTENFVREVRMKLSDGGIAVFNRLYFGEKRKTAVKFAKKLEKLFNKVDYYYPEANLVFICFS